MSDKEFSNHAIGILQEKNTTPTILDEYESANNDEKMQILSQSPHALIKAREKTITIGKKQYSVDPYDLIFMIRRTTSHIGQYNDNENEPYAAYMTHALRTARNDMASALEANFGIHFAIDNNGKSTFYIG